MQSHTVQSVIHVLDNSSALLSLYKAELEDCGYTVFTYQQVDQSLELSRSQPPNLYIIGAELQGSDCLDLIKRLHSDDLLCNIPIILLSSTRSVELRRACFNAGVTDFVSKNATQTFLIERVNLVLNRQHNLAKNRLAQREKFHLLVADDSPSILALYGHLLEQMGIEATLCSDGIEALNALKKNPGNFDLILTDLEMPKMSGQTLLKRVRANNRFDQTPILVVTRFEANEMAVQLLNEGATDFIHKPFSPEELSARISSHLRNRLLLREQYRLSNELSRLNQELEQRVAERTHELREANQEVITKLSLVCDYKDQDTGNHINRVRLYCEEMGKSLGMSAADVEHFGYSSMLHDVGKVSIPDAILRKPGPLNEQEWDIMKTHPSKGAELLGDRPFFATAREIALSHHERVDGTGYPSGLQGDEIPITARIVAIVDVYDALTSKRCYKPAWTEQDAVHELGLMAGTHLDAALVERMIALKDQGVLDQIRKTYP